MFVQRVWIATHRLRQSPESGYLSEALVDTMTGNEAHGQKKRKNTKTALTDATRDTLSKPAGWVVGAFHNLSGDLIRASGCDVPTEPARILDTHLEKRYVRDDLDATRHTGFTRVIQEGITLRAEPSVPPTL